MCSCRTILAFAALALIGHDAVCAPAGHEECERQFKRLSKGLVTGVPQVQDWGDSREYYYAWNNGSKSTLLQTKSGRASGSCVIDRRTGEGFVTLNSKDLGTFKAKAPL